MYVCVYMSVYIYVCFAYVSIYAHMCFYVYSCMCVCVSVYMHFISLL